MTFTIWPLYSFDIQTTIPPETVVLIIRANIEPSKSFAWPINHAYFQGVCSSSAFALQRITHGRNSIRIVITGTISPHYSGSTIKIKMRLPALELIIFLIWSSFLIFIVMILTFATFTNPSAPHIGILGPLIFLTIGIAIFCGRFWWQVPRERSMFVDLLNPHRMGEPRLYDEQQPPL